MSIPPAPGAKRPGGADPRRRPDASEPLGFAPTPEESAFFAEMFRRADVDGSGAIAPSVVLQLLPKSGLGQDSLRAVRLRNLGGHDASDAPPGRADLGRRRLGQQGLPHDGRLLSRAEASCGRAGRPARHRGAPQHEWVLRAIEPLDSG